MQRDRKKKLEHKFGVLNRLLLRGIFKVIIEIMTFFILILQVIFFLILLF